LPTGENMKYTKITVLLKNKPPYFIGSQIRGALGYSLKKISCINPVFKCDNCFAINNCLYYSLYEEKNNFHKFRLDFELGSEYYDFSIYLFDKYVEKLPYIISALNMMFTQTGIGRDRITYKKFDIFINDKNSIKNGKIELPKNYEKIFQIDKRYQNISLEFITPLRIKKQNRFIRDESIELKDIVNSIYQRQMRLLGREFKKFPYETKGEIVKKELHYKELTRKSNRQKTTMNLGGIIGKVEIKDINKESFEVLKLGELIGVGKSTVFGLGKIKVGEI
jgi:hypothetical protein